MPGAPYLQIEKDVVTVRRKIEPSARGTPVAADLVTPPYGDGAAVTHPTSCY